ncbi:MAG: AraC family transcriptional regulator, partial [Acidobacteria bacterium]|nr:AraC family transcriptional regulator [Acidobacteriota bacterium]MCC6744808.1 AraC family transcriptional regulator [Acidobacteriota bacterium]
MIDTPEIVRTSDQLTAYIHITIPRHEISTVMGPGISELMTTVGAQGIAVTGPWF